MSTSEPRFPARFEPDPWDEDLARSTSAGHQAAGAARHDYQPNGIPISHLKACEAEGRDGTNLPDCAKVYLPQPDGKFGAIFKAVRIDGRLRLDFLAFGMRHHPPNSHAPTVYDIAHRRLSS